MTADQTTSEDQWWVAVQDKPTGPYSTGYVFASLRSGLILPDQLLCSLIADEWRAAKDWPQFNSHKPTAMWSQVSTNAESNSAAVVQATVLGELISPQRLIQALVVYGLMVNPVLWFTGIITGCGAGTNFADGTDAQSAEFLWHLAERVFNLVPMILWVCAALCLNASHRRGFWLAIAAYGSEWLLGLAMIGAMIVMFAAFPDAEQRVQQPVEVAISIVSLLLAIVVFAFETVAIALLIAFRRAIAWKPPMYPAEGGK